MLTFRPARPDAPDARALLEEYFAARAADFPGGSYSPTFPAPDAFAEPDGVLLLANDEQGALVGCGAIRRLAVDAPGTVRFEVKHIFLRGDSRGRGWGVELMAELERRAIDWGATELVLDTHHTLVPAGRLYARLGYEQVEAYNDNPNATRWYRKAV
ncbi:hypothetical protein GCM10025768_12270 [Microbacterium pseudoresistens]|uniref:GNAT superfamily N-acetyltransferase n=1 Tax=Microbacterium pseudoresistens TaxID=640634 RepID=A0A7Y9EXY8_9MICO|nr:GNAT family N-acetyltransferase [Microbacterium pseudoresistens]NYD55130.1 GNAT superfamily N-acetyltransferase [Microbacterium pseudoresistens]